LVWLNVGMSVSHVTVRIQSPTVRKLVKTVLPMAQSLNEIAVHHDISGTANHFWDVADFLMPPVCA